MCLSSQYEVTSSGYTVASCGFSLATPNNKVSYFLCAEPLFQPSSLIFSAGLGAESNNCETQTDPNLIFHRSTEIVNFPRFFES